MLICCSYLPGTMKGPSVKHLPHIRRICQLVIHQVVDCDDEWFLLYITLCILACGATMSADEKAFFPTPAKEEAILGTIGDGTSRQDYSYAVFVKQETDDYNLQEGRLQLTVYKEDSKGNYKPCQYITVPVGDSINKQDKKVYFAGCLRPDANKIDMDLNGFYSYNQNIKNTGSTITDPKLCETLRTMNH